MGFTRTSFQTQQKGDADVYTYSNWTNYGDGYNPNNDWIVGTHFYSGYSAWAWSRIKLVTDSNGVSSFKFSVPFKADGSGSGLYYRLTDSATTSMPTASQGTQCTKTSNTSGPLYGTITTTIPANSTRYLYLYYQFRIRRYYWLCW